MAPEKKKMKANQKTMLQFFPKAPERENKTATKNTILHYFPKNGGPAPLKQKSIVTPDWRLQFIDFCKIRCKAREEGMFTDIKFVVGEGDQRKEFHAHKAILASASPVFECMIYGPTSENRTVIETDDDPEAFDMLLEFIYGGDSITSIDSMITAKKFFTIGNKYLVYKIEKKIKESFKYIYRDDDDFWNLIQDNDFNVSCPLIRDKLRFYIMENTNEFLELEKWLTAPETVVKDILQMDKLNIDEYSLLKAVTKWVYHNKKEVTPKNLVEYYKHIRFSTLSRYELMNFVEKYPKALESETYLAILRHAHGKTGHSLPDWCSTSKEFRVEEYKNFRYSGHYDW